MITVSSLLILFLTLSNDYVVRKTKQTKIMKKKFIKATLAVAAIAAVGLSSYKAYGSYTAANMSEEELLWAENVLALSHPENLSGQKVRVRAEYLGYCWTNYSQIAQCGSCAGCNVYIEDWEKGAKQYRCFDMPVERYRKETTWTASKPTDEDCSGYVGKSKPGEGKKSHDSPSCPHYRC